MFFGKQSDNTPAPQEGTLAQEAVEAAQPAPQDNYSALTHALMTLGNQLKKRHYMVSISGQAYYPVTYLAEVVMFAGRLVSEYSDYGRLSSEASTNWFANRLPIMQAMPIEIGPKELVAYVKQAIQADPIGQITLSDEMMVTLQRFISLHLPADVAQPATMPASPSPSTH